MPSLAVKSTVSWWSCRPAGCGSLSGGVIDPGNRTGLSGLTCRQRFCPESSSCAQGIPPIRHNSQRCSSASLIALTCAHFKGSALILHPVLRRLQSAYANYRMTNSSRLAVMRGGNWDLHPCRAKAAKTAKKSGTLLFLQSVRNRVDSVQQALKWPFVM